MVQPALRPPPQARFGDADPSSLPKTVARHLAQAAQELSEAPRRLWYDRALGEASLLMCGGRP